MRGAAIPARTLAIGDIHGCARQFEALLDSFCLTTADRLILLGDLVDRGPGSAEVLRQVRKLSRLFNVNTIKGNHEQMMLEARDSHDKFTDWLKSGGDATLKSYAGVRGALRDVPDEDWDFLSNRLVNYVETEAHIFVHANAYPDMSLEEQPDYMLRWERCDRMQRHQSGKMIVCGHTPQKAGRPLNLGFGVCLDTHACGGGPLTALDVSSGIVWQVSAQGRIQKAHINDY